jgi:hypothetical protein
MHETQSPKQQACRADDEQGYSSQHEHQDAKPGIFIIAGDEAKQRQDHRRDEQPPQQDEAAAQQKADGHASARRRTSGEGGGPDFNAASGTYITGLMSYVIQGVRRACWSYFDRAR